MPALTADELRALLAGGCPTCRRNHLAVRAIETGATRFLDGEPVSAVTWTYAPGELRARRYRLSRRAGARTARAAPAPACGAARCDRTGLGRRAPRRRRSLPSRRAPRRPRSLCSRAPARRP